MASIFSSCWPRRRYKKVLPVLCVILFLSFQNTISKINPIESSISITTTTTTTTTSKKLATGSTTTTTTTTSREDVDVVDDDEEEEVIQQTIQLNTKSPTSNNSINSIIHYPSRNRIHVNLKSNNAVCSNPYLVGRLSGPALISLHWHREKQLVVQQSSSSNSISSSSSLLSDDNNDVVFVGTYSSPLSGIFFLEIIIIYCEDIQQQKFTMNFTETCIENPSTHRLTSDDTLVTIQKHNLAWKISPGYWIHKKNLSSSHEDQQEEEEKTKTKKEDEGTNNSSSIINFKPMYTRYQHPDCYPTPLSSCIILPNDHSIDYEFHWSATTSMENSHTNNNNDTTTTTTTLFNNNNVSFFRQVVPKTICLIGASHSRKLFNAAMDVGIHSETTNITMKHYRFLYPGDVVHSSIKQHNLDTDCDCIIIGVGQWALSSKPIRGPFHFPKYYQQFKDMLQRLQSLIPSHIPIMARSIHYNPLSSIVSTCPPTDWRIPPIIDGYNYYIKRAVEEVSSSSGGGGGGSYYYDDDDDDDRNNNSTTRHHLNNLTTTTAAAADYNHDHLRRSTEKKKKKKKNRITFVDTNFIVSPMWDSSSDWCHLDPFVSNIEIFYLIAKAVNIPVPSPYTPTTTTSDNTER